MKSLGEIAANVSDDLKRRLDHTARVRVMSALIPEDVDLGDERAVILALVGLRFTGPEIADALDEAVTAARERRAQ